MMSSNPFVLVAPATRREAGTVVVSRKIRDAAVRRREERIDEVVSQSFPASDPPSWNMGVADPDAWR